MSSLLLLQQKEALREQTRRRVEELSRQKLEIENALENLEAELVVLDDEIDALEDEEEEGRLLQQESSQGDFLTDPATQIIKSEPSLPPPPPKVIARGVAPLQLMTTNRRPTKSKTLDSSLLKPAASTKTVSSSITTSHDNSIDYHLKHTFKIQAFRDQQRQVIQATLAQKDVFCIMRTGGGKSLTYQLPSVMERPKVTFVISPLLSLIQDQEEQMNLFLTNSATSFTSTVSTSEQTNRWNLIRNPQSGICLVFITPEKVQKSGRLKKELQKLYDQNRLGRFVIDEAHCSSNWGHDFRPDYAQLGILKAHFPNTPIMAVTATASDQVRQDVCKILGIDRSYEFFRSTANRPNLTYSVRPKPDKKQLIEDMAEYIRTNYPGETGIVYTFTRKEADTVAASLDSLGISSASYHAEVSATRKQQIHRKWMKNQIQVVVATIAFGLGINKPDVRFVLHHSMSKTLEAYYQESGRAGRDGLPADCVLYYCPKDVSRLIKLVHGTSADPLLWPMVRYAQASGNDAVCKAIILSTLGEPNSPDPKQVLIENDGKVSETRDVGAHARTVTKLLYELSQDGDLFTLNQLVKEWRKKPATALPCVQENPPTDLSISECERIIVALLLEGILDTKVKWNAYDGSVYLVPGKLAMRLLHAPNPSFVIRFPLSEKKPAKARKTSTSTKAAKSSSGKQKEIKKRKAKTDKKLKTKKPKKAKSVKEAPALKEPAIIEILDDSDSSDDEMPSDLKPAAKRTVTEDSDSESEFEF